MTTDWGTEGRAANLARWDEAAPLPDAASELYDLEGFRTGRNDIRPFEHIELGRVAGLDLVHLQRHLGTDTLSWARRGARVVGLDFSPAAIEVATQLAIDCEIEAEFVCSDVYDARYALAGRAFDIVYTGIGALGWLLDLDERALVVDGLLRPVAFCIWLKFTRSCSAYWVMVAPSIRTFSRLSMSGGRKRAARMPSRTRHSQTHRHLNVRTHSAK